MIPLTNLRCTSGRGGTNLRCTSGRGGQIYVVPAVGGTSGRGYQR